MRLDVKKITEMMLDLGVNNTEMAKRMAATSSNISLTLCKEKKYHNILTIKKWAKALRVDWRKIVEEDI